VTDAPCETCHFNTSTFMGARFNHGTAQPGQCATCHNGRLSTGRPANHNSGNKAIKSCDQCHRSYAWLPSSWNHIGVAPRTCRTCHVSSPDVSAENRLPAAHSTPKQYTLVAKSDIRFECDDCHNFIRWVPATFSHNTAAACDTCHTMKPGHIATAAGAACGNCHRLRTSWLPASLHAGNEAGICRTCHATTPQPSSHSGAAYQVSCDACHTQTNWVFNHAAQQGRHTCNSCHSRSSHHGSGTQPCDNCHNVRKW
jgi:predicted CXXCH cytochrome family protein